MEEYSLEIRGKGSSKARRWGGGGRLSNKKDARVGQCVFFFAQNRGMPVKFPGKELYDSFYQILFKCARESKEEKNAQEIIY